MGVFPAANSADEHGIVCVGGDLRPALLLAAYREGLFPMPVQGHLAWWSPDPRAILPPEGMHVSRSLRRTRRRYEIRVDTAFAEVIDGCADRRRPHGWITREVRDAYVRLHELGWAHSVEAFDTTGCLAGGLYGVAIPSRTSHLPAQGQADWTFGAAGGLFAAESMFHRATDASKAALAALAERLGPGALIDVQWLTPHLASLGAVEIPRAEYLQRLARAVSSG